VRKGISVLISYVFIVAIVISGIGLVLSIGTPVLEQSKDTAAIEQARETLTGIDGEIRSIASQGPRSTTSYRFSNQRGEYGVYPSNDTINYSIETDAEVVSTGTTTRFGNLWLTGRNGSILLTINYTDIDLRGGDKNPEGSGRTTGPGLHSLTITNAGAGGGRTLINVTLG